VTLVNGAATGAREQTQAVEDSKNTSGEETYEGSGATKKAEASLQDDKKLTEGAGGASKAQEAPQAAKSNDTSTETKSEGGSMTPPRGASLTSSTAKTINFADPSEIKPPPGVKTTPAKKLTQSNPISSPEGELKKDEVITAKPPVASALKNANEEQDLPLEGGESVKKENEDVEKEKPKEPKEKVTTHPEPAEKNVPQVETPSEKVAPEAQKAADEPFEVDYRKNINPVLGEEETSKSNFLGYFIVLSIVTIVAYLVFHNKKKILGLIVEGRGSRQAGRRRSGGREYRKLDSNMEDMLDTGKETSMRQVIY